MPRRSMTAEAFWFHTPTVVTGFLINDTRHTSRHASLVHFRLSLLRKSLLRKCQAYEKLLVFLDQNFVSEIVKRDLDTKVKPEFNEFYEFLKEGFIMDKLVVSLSTKRSSSRS